MPTMTIKMRLLKAGDEFTEDTAMKEGHGLATLHWDGIAGARMFAGRVYDNPPPWRDFVAARATNLPDMSNGGSAAILFVPVEVRTAEAVIQRTVVVCFGHAHLVTNENHFERNFGLRVTLNRVAHNCLRSLDAATPDATTVQKRIQTSRNSDISLFGLDLDRDLLSEAAGVPRDANFAKFLAGRDSLSITCEITPAGILNKCREVLEDYLSTDYQNHFAWIDHVQIVRDQELARQLDESIFAALADLVNGDGSDLHLSPPEIVDYVEGSELRYLGLGERGEIYSHLAIEDYVAELVEAGMPENMETLRISHKVSARNRDNERFTEKWRVYDCFVFDTEQGGHRFVLFGGQWFRVDVEFGNEVQRFFEGIPRVNTIGTTRERNEQGLITYLERNRPDLLKLDRDLVTAAGLPRDGIEACDFLSQNREFIHLKDGHSSGSISHLYMQGVVSAEAFGGNRNFRSALRQKVQRRNRNFVNLLPHGNTHQLNRGDYKVVYGIMRKPNRAGELTLPFFSKVSLRSAVQRLNTLGFPVALNLIEKQQ